LVSYFNSSKHEPSAPIPFLGEVTKERKQVKRWKSLLIIFFGIAHVYLTRS
jgi:hypothetical protein